MKRAVGGVKRAGGVNVVPGVKNWGIGLMPYFLKTFPPSANFVRALPPPSPPHGVDVQGISRRLRTEQAEA